MYNICIIHTIIRCAIKQTSNDMAQIYIVKYLKNYKEYTKR